MLRYERKMRRAHQMIAHLRTECYPMYRRSFLSGLPEPGRPHDLTVTEQELRIDRAKRRMGYLGEEENAPTPNIQELLDRSGGEH
jgi:hypothetical protein